MSRKKVNKSEVIRRYFTAGLSVKEIKEKINKNRQYLYIIDALSVRFQ